MPERAWCPKDERGQKIERSHTSLGCGERSCENRDRAIPTSERGNAILRLQHSYVSQSHYTDFSLISYLD